MGANLSLYKEKGNNLLLKKLKVTGAGGSGGFKGGARGSCPSLTDLKQVWRPFLEIVLPFRFE